MTIEARLLEIQALLSTIDNQRHKAQRIWDHDTDTIHSPTPGGSTPPGTHSDPTATTATRRRTHRAETDTDRALRDATTALDRAANTITRTLQGETHTGPCTICGKGGAGQPLTTRTIGTTPRLICDHCRRSWDRKVWEPGEWITSRQGIRTTKGQAA
jgi:hypothetical protein